MKNLLLLLVFLIQTAFAEPSVLTENTDPAAQENAQTQGNDSEGNGIDSLFSNVSNTTGALSIEYSHIPEHLYVGEIFSITIKLTPLEIASGNIEYTLQNDEGIRIFSDTPKRQVKSDGVYDTFYFLVQADSIRLPDISATATSTGAVSNVLTGSSINATALNAPATYANVLAHSFKVTAYKTTAYDKENNIVVFSVNASLCNIGTFSLPNAIKQGFESKIPNVDNAQMTYYAVIPNTAQNLEFTIFNLSKNRYESINIPIVVDDDAVSTQSDLSPTDARHTELKVGGAAIVTVILIAMFYWRENKNYLIASILPFFYVVYTLLPNENVCIKKGSPVYLLPINHGTIFEMTVEEESLEAENRVGDFTKVRLDNKKVGWVQDRDLCSN